MSLQQLLSTIHQITDQKVQAILEEARREAENKIEEAKRTAEKNRKEAYRAKEKELESRERSELAMEELSWKRRMLQVKAEALNKIFAKAMEKISKMTHEPRYRKFLHSAVVEAILKIPGSEYVVTANERDRETLQKDLKEIEERLREAGRPEVKIQVSNDRLDSVGGVLVYNKAAQKYFNNTVEARFIQAQTRLKGRLYRQLFGGKPDAR